MSQIVTGIIIAVAGAVIVHWLGLDGTRVVVVYGAKRTKKWKVLIVLSWVMMLVGIYLTVTHAPEGGLSNPFTKYGAELLIAGFVLLQVGRFGVWWNRN